MHSCKIARIINIYLIALLFCIHTKPLWQNSSKIRVNKRSWYRFSVWYTWAWQQHSSCCAIVSVACVYILSETKTLYQRGKPSVKILYNGAGESVKQVNVGNFQHESIPIKNKEQITHHHIILNFHA